MLTRLQLKRPFRSLAENTFPTGVNFGKRTIIYGHNGSGKSSVAELLYQISEKTCTESYVWYDPSASRSGTRDSAPEDVKISVFTKSWVTKNLREFLEGDSADVIVTIGEAAGSAKEDELRYADELKVYTPQLDMAVSEVSAREDAVSTILKSVRDSIDTSLREFDSRIYTKNAYNVNKVRGLLAKKPTSVLTEEEHQANLKELHKPPPAVPSMPMLPSADLKNLELETEQLCELSVQGEPIEALLGKKELARWLQTALTLHSDQDNCQFCTNVIPPERLKELRGHFDESRQRIQDEARELLEKVEEASAKYAHYLSSLPQVESVYEDLQDDLREALRKEQDSVGNITGFLESLAETIRTKSASPEIDGLELILPSLPTKPGACVSVVIDKHKERVNKDREWKSGKAEEAANYLVASQLDAYETAKSKYETSLEDQQSLDTKVKELKELLTQARDARHSTQEMADKLTSDLEAVYGKSHLSIRLSSDRKGYVCYREGVPARNLSEGERNTLALVYFLRYLQDQKEEVKDENRLIVVDDPSSSLDREAVFATHAWLLDSLKNYGQTIILTHDFEMLRLLLESQERQRINSVTALKKPDKAEGERAYPKISFLEMRCGHDGQRRRSVLEPMSNEFLQHKTEYHFLFARVLSGLADDTDHSLLFLLPNAARRVLEAFTRFHMPSQTGFKDRVELLATNLEHDSFRDVIDFCHRFSHGQPRIMDDILDARTSSQEVRRCMEFIRAVDKNHYDQMVKVTKKEDPLV
ncbi:AAA family ATPase [Nesterenkonia pannonica]|uniref:AAA family ATPase n=1 Tax=Nesterenkonia pannonica TaxID=1548602 RepID=UPI002164DC4B|nr:AAA family ATPase [Nesterenkonia pannonica]